MTYLNINSIRNKFDEMTDLLLNHKKAILITKTKLDSSFPNGKLHIERFYQPYRLNVSCHNSMILAQMKSELPPKAFKIQLLHLHLMFKIRKSCKEYAKKTCQ